MKIKVFHAEMDDYGRIISPKIVQHGHINMPNFNEEKCWHMCNWFHWSEEKPKNVHCDIDNCNHGLILRNPQTKEYWLALSQGWIHGSERYIRGYISRNWHKTFWNENEMDELPPLNGVLVYSSSCT